MPGEIIEIVQRNVHDCRADAEGRPCYFEWYEHVESDKCSCGPRVDERNLLIDGQVFIVHQGVC